jgi:4'-phosphopantetheinyl transferase
VQGEHKSPTAAGTTATRRQACPELEIFFVDLVRAEAFLAAEEERTPRLSVADHERARAIADIQAQRLWCASRIATRIVIERFGGERFRGVAFQIDPGGRPVLGDGGPQFSVSHTNGAALIAVSMDMAVGVDLEAKTRMLHMSNDRRQRIIRAAERLGPQPRLLGAENDGDVIAAWVQLEAVAKALGIGIGRLLTEEGVVGGSKSKSGAPTDYRLAVQALSVENAYIAAIAAPRIPEDLKVESFPHADIAAFLRRRR